MLRILSFDTSDVVYMPFGDGSWVPGTFREDQLVGVFTAVRSNDETTSGSHPFPQSKAVRQRTMV